LSRDENGDEAMSSNSALVSHTSLAAVRNSAVKRNRVRKGTFSCWECKRRKTRCKFDSNNAAGCVSCVRRGVSCIGQEFAEPHADRVERTGKRFHNEEAADRETIQRPRNDRTSSPVCSERTNGSNNDALDHSVIRSAPSMLSYINNNNSSNKGYSYQTSSYLLSASHKLFPSLYPSDSSISNRLFAAIPHSTQAADILARGGFSTHPIHIRSKLLNEPGIFSMDQSYEVSPNAHPAVLARKLLQLALCLHQLEDPLFNTAEQYVKIASRYVTSQDTFMASFEGLETLLLEACYFINIGNIYKAWLIIRRAISIAQLIGVTPKGNILTTRAERIWYRLMSGDRWLSWVLGLPIATPDHQCMSAYASDDIEDLSPSLKFERSQIDVLGKIIVRNVRMQESEWHDHENENENVGSNFRGYDDYNKTQELDLELKQAAQSMPSHWWVYPTLDCNQSGMQINENTQELFTQIHHYFLLSALHLPYFMRYISSSSMMSNNTTFVNPRSPFDFQYTLTVSLIASREHLSRFVVLRQFHRKLSYRGVDDKAFIAATMLLLGHTSCHRLGRMNPFGHQRFQDLAIVNSFIRLLDDTSRSNQDRLSASMVPILEKLVDIEMRAANGEIYAIRGEETTTAGATTTAAAADGNDGLLETPDESSLNLPFPYLGSIIIKQLSSHTYLRLDELDLSLGSVTELLPDTVGPESSGLVDSTSNDRPNYSCTSIDVLLDTQQTFQPTNIVPSQGQEEDGAAFFPWTDTMTYANID
jgi:hypothetical protein